MAQPPVRRRRSYFPVIVFSALAGALALTLLVYLLGTIRDSRTRCTSLRVVASSEKAPLLSELARRYNDSDRSVAGGSCGTVSVRSVASGVAMEALRHGWKEDRDGPAPQVWSPAASSWVTLLRQRTAESDGTSVVPDGSFPSIATTPLVLAMPRPMAMALGWPETRLGWADVRRLIQDPRGWGAVGHPEWGRFRLGKTNPRFSTSGLHATLGQYMAATGRTSELTAADLASDEVRTFVSGVESGVVHYGDTTLTFLDNLLDADQQGRGLSYISAVAVEEKSVHDYNEGNPSGDRSRTTRRVRPRIPLVAVYPKEGGLRSDNPYVTLTSATDAQRAVARDFLRFLRESAQQRTLTDEGFRDHNGRPGRGVRADDGLLAEATPKVLPLPSPSVLTQTLGSWDGSRKRARLLLVLDVSGSMEELVNGTQKSKLDLAKQAALLSLAMLAPDDEVGLWTFSGSVTPGGAPYSERVPVGAVRDNLAQLRLIISRLTPQGATALYATARAATRSMAARTDPSRINAVVVLSDGRNEFAADDDLNRLLTDLDMSDQEIPIRVFTIAYGTEADVATLRRIARVSGGGEYDARDPATIDRVLTNVLSNF